MKAMGSKFMPPTVRPFVAAALLCFLVPLVSCSRKPVVPAGPPAAANPAVLNYEAAEESFEKGDYASAVKGYEEYLLANMPEYQDRAFFRLGISYGLAPEKPQNLRQARGYLQRLVSEFPRSSYRAPADMILVLLTQIDRLNGRVNEQQVRIRNLTEELQLLKAIDMKRNPSRPPP